MHDPECPHATRLAAADFIYTRAWGKAPANVETNGEIGVSALRIEFIQAPQSDQRAINGGADPRVIELDPSEQADDK